MSAFCVILLLCCVSACLTSLKDYNYSNAAAFCKVAFPFISFYFFVQFFSVLAHLKSNIVAAKTEKNKKNGNEILLTIISQAQKYNRGGAGVGNEK